jgi:hypothetical protein
MAYRCENCGRHWSDRDASDNEFLCIRKCGGILKVVQPGDTIEPLVPNLPHPLAVVLQDYLRETNDYFKLHRLCDAAEMLTRFLATVALAEIYEVFDSKKLPEALRTTIRDGIERPTFGVWAAILDAAMAALPGSSLLIPELQPLGRRVLTLLGTDKDPISEAIISLRNEIAHSRIGLEEVRELLAAHTSKFDALWKDELAAFLSELELLGITEGGLCMLLRGSPVTNETFPTYDATRLRTGSASNSPWATGSIVLTRPGSDRFVILYPLQAFGPIVHQVGERLKHVTQDPVTQVYSRYDRLVQYTAFHPHYGHADGTAAMQAAFDNLFPLRSWDETDREAEKAKEARIADAAWLHNAAREYSFRDVIDSLLRESFVGRGRELTGALAWLNQHSTGVALILGQPGMGKTAFAARLSVEVKKQHKEWLCLRHFFKIDDDRCSTRKFMVGVLLQLQLAGGARIELPADDIEARVAFVNALETFSCDHLGSDKGHLRLVLLLDGMDEIAQRDPKFFEIIRGCQIDKIAWLCLARPEPAVLEGLPESAAERLFPSPAHPNQPGLPPLDRQAVRQYLMEELGRCRYALLEEETDEGASHFLDALSDSARCLPLYLYLLAEDMRRGEFDPKHPEKLPENLDAYYDRLMDRLGLDAARKVLPDVIALLAVARTPLTIGMLGNLLSQHSLHHDPEWDAIFSTALRLGHPVMKMGYLWEGKTGYTLYHNSFRDYLLQGEAKSYVDSRLGPVLRQAKRRVLDLCRGWREWPANSDESRYLLRHYTAHLYESRDYNAAAQGELIQLMLESDFLQVKVRQLGDPHEAVEDVRLLTLTLIEKRESAKIIELAFTDLGYQRDGISAGLGEAANGPTADDRTREQVSAIASELVTRHRQFAILDSLRRRLPRWKWLRRFGVATATLNARQVAFTVALDMNLKEIFRESAHDRSDAVQALLIPYLFRYWQKNRTAGWELLKELVDEIWSHSILPDQGVLIVAGGMALHILIQHLDDSAVLLSLRDVWKPAVRNARRKVESTFGKVFIRFLAMSLLWVMATQPDYQPLNARELRYSFRRRRRHHAQGLEVLQDLRNPERGVKETLNILVQEKPSYDVFLMVVAERTLVFHGCQNPAAMIPELFRVHREGPAWFRQSVLYVCFQIFNKISPVQDAWLAQYESLTFATWGHAGTWSSDKGIYDLSPHLAWLELAFEKHRPRSAKPRELFIPQFYQKARQHGDEMAVRRVLEACKVLTLGYKMPGLALETLQPAIEDWATRRGGAGMEQRSGDVLVEMLADIRFYNVIAVDTFLSKLGNDELRRIVARTPPNLSSSDITSWVDEFTNARILKSDRFRREVVAAFGNAGNAEGLFDFLERIFNWVMHLIVVDETA